MKGLGIKDIDPVLKKRYPGDKIRPGKERRKRFNNIKRVLKEKSKSLKQQQNSR